jgi:hypothetical protein
LEHFRVQSGQILGKMTNNHGRPDPVQGHGTRASGGHAEDYKARFYEKLLQTKLQLPAGHPVKNILVSECHAECLERRINT